jgi:hypothetical protein
MPEGQAEFLRALAAVLRAVPKGLGHYSFSMLSTQQKRNSPHVSLTKLFSQKSDCASLGTPKAQAADRAWPDAVAQVTPVLMFES